MVETSAIGLGTTLPVRILYRSFGVIVFGSMVIITACLFFDF